MATLVELLQEQIDCLQNDDYNYTEIHIYLTGDSEPWEFTDDKDFKIDEHNGTLVVRDIDEDGDPEEAPENIISINQIAGSMLIP
jgi:hypothetical protein